MKAYKLFKREPLSSFYVTGPSAFHYDLHEVNIPKRGYGPFACFKTVEAVKRFLQRPLSPWEVLFEVEIEPTDECSLWTPYRTVMAVYDGDWILARKVKLVKEVSL